MQHGIIHIHLYDGFPQALEESAICSSQSMDGLLASSSSSCRTAALAFPLLVQIKPVSIPGHSRRLVQPCTDFLWPFKYVTHPAWVHGARYEVQMSSCVGAFPAMSESELASMPALVDLAPQTSSMKYNCHISLDYSSMAWGPTMSLQICHCKTISLAKLQKHIWTNTNCPLYWYIWLVSLLIHSLSPSSSPSALPPSPPAFTTISTAFFFPSPPALSSASVNGILF